MQMSGYIELMVIRINKQGAAFIAVKLGKRISLYKQLQFVTEHLKLKSFSDCFTSRAHKLLSRLV